jgi:hypothetical protein
MRRIAAHCPFYSGIFIQEKKFPWYPIPPIHQTLPFVTFSSSLESKWSYKGENLMTTL